MVSNRNTERRPPLARLTGREELSVPYVVAALVAGVFFGGVGGGVAFPTLPTLGAVLGIAPFVVGLILSANRFTRLLMNTPAGQILDRIGTRRPMILGFVVQGSAPFGYVLGLNADLIPISAGMVFLLSRAAWGIGSAFVFVGGFTTITHITTPANRGRWIGYMRGFQSLGFPTGLVVGGIVADAFGYAEAFAVAGVAGLFAALVAFLVLPNVDADVDEPTRLRDLPTLVRADDRLLAVGSVNFVIRFLYSGVLLSTVVLYTQENDIAFSFLSGVGVSGVVMAVSVVCLALTTLVIGRISDGAGNRALVTVPGLAVFGLGFVVLGLFPTVEGALIGIALAGFGVGGVGPPMMAYLGDISPEADVGKLGGVYNVFGDLGSTIGPLVALPLAARVPVAVEYLLCVAFVVMTVVMVAAVFVGDTGDPVEAPLDVVDD